MALWDRWYLLPRLHQIGRRQAIWQHGGRRTVSAPSGSYTCRSTSAITTCQERASRLDQWWLGCRCVAGLLAYERVDLEVTRGQVGGPLGERDYQQVA